MYQCHIHFYLAGHNDRVFGLVKEMHPMEHFTHTFVESEQFEEGLAGQADVILANCKGLGASGMKRAAQVLRAAGEAEIILLADGGEVPAFVEDLPGIRDIWTGEMSDRENCFCWMKMGKN